MATRYIPREVNQLKRDFLAACVTNLDSCLGVSLVEVSHLAC